MRHMELADLAWYLRSAPPPDGSPFHAVVEYAQNMWDFANRLAGGAFPNRINVTPRRAVVVVAPRIDLSDRLPAYRNDKRRASADALSELESAYLECIKEIRNEG
jgi:hypothetical protein